MPRGCCSSSSLLNAPDLGSALAGGSVSQQLRAQTERELTARNAQRNSGEALGLWHPSILGVPEQP